jgi:hypothetical protein
VTAGKARLRRYKRPAIVFFGGGREQGSVQQFEPQAAYATVRHPAPPRLCGSDHRLCGFGFGRSPPGGSANAGASNGKRAARRNSLFHGNFQPYRGSRLVRHGTCLGKGTVFGGVAAVATTNGDAGKLSHDPFLGGCGTCGGTATDRLCSGAGSTNIRRRNDSSSESYFETRTRVP